MPRLGLGWLRCLDSLLMHAVIVTASARLLRSRHTARIAAI